MSKAQMIEKAKDALNKGEVVIPKPISPEDLQRAKELMKKDGFNPKIIGFNPKIMNSGRQPIRFRLSSQGQERSPVTAQSKKKVELTPQQKERRQRKFKRWCMRNGVRVP